MSICILNNRNGLDHYTCQTVPILRNWYPNSYGFILTNWFVRGILCSTFLIVFSSSYSQDVIFKEKPVKPKITQNSKQQIITVWSDSPFYSKKDDIYPTGRFPAGTIVKVLTEGGMNQVQCPTGDTVWISSIWLKPLDPIAAREDSIKKITRTTHAAGLAAQNPYVMIIDDWIYSDEYPKTTITRLPCGTLLDISDESLRSYKVRTDKYDGYVWISAVRDLEYGFENNIPIIADSDSMRKIVLDRNIKFKAKANQKKQMAEKRQQEEVLRKTNAELQHSNDLRKKYVGSEFIATILSKKIRIGMTDEMVLDSWGKPENKNKTVGSWGVHEQWVYGSTYLYFENGLLTSYQTQK